MVNIRLNEFDRKILANIKPSDKWSKFKNIFILNSEIKKLKIGNTKIGTKCSQHLRKLSNKNIVTLNEIKDSCKDLIPKKHKHGLVKDKTKKEVLKEHTKLDIGQEKEKEKPKHKKAASTKKATPTQQLVNLLTAQQTAVRTQTIASNIAKVDKILTDRNQNAPKTVQPIPERQLPDLQLRTQPLGSQFQDTSANLKMRLLEGSLLDRERGLSNIASNLEKQKQLLKEKLNNPSLLQSVSENTIRKQNVGSKVSDFVSKETIKIKQAVNDGKISHSDAQKRIEDLNNRYINHLQNREAQNLQSQNVLKDIEELEKQKQIRLANRKEGVDSVLTRLRNRENQEQQDRLVNELIIDENQKKMKDIQSELLGTVSSRAEANERQKQTENTLGNLQGEVMQRVSGMAEQQNIFDRNTRLNLEKSESLEDMFDYQSDNARTNDPGSFSARLPETKSYEELQENFKIAQRKRDRLLNKPRVSRRQKRKQQAAELLELQKKEQQTSDLVDKIILDTEETNLDVDKFKKEMVLEKKKIVRKKVIKVDGTKEEVAMEEDRPIKSMMPEDIIGRPKSRYVIKGGLGTPSEVYGNPDSAFYNTNYKKILNEYVNQSRNSPIYNQPMRNNFAQTWDIINKVKNAKVYTAESKTKDVRHRKDYQKDLLKQLHARNVEQLMDRYLLEKDPETKEYFKYAGIGAEQYFKSENPNEDPQYKLFNKINKRKGGMSANKFIEDSKLLDVDNADSKEWDRNAERLKEFHEEWDNEMSESAKRNYMASSRDMISTGLGQEGFNELPY